jgi:hypothetical protein
MSACYRPATAPAATLAGAFLALAAFSAYAQEIPVPVPRPEIEAPAAAQPMQAESSEPAKQEAPATRPTVYQTACPALRSGLVTGRMAPPVDDNGCLARSPLAVSALGKDGAIALRSEALLSCAMAGTLAQFAGLADATAREMFGAGLATIDAGPGYQCRRRNGETSGKLSEHAFANALDIAGFILTDGRRFTIAEHWPRQEGDEENLPPAARAKDDAGRYMVRIRDQACTLFTTVLGPDSNTAHESHFHFDLGCHGRSCTYYICE